MPYKLMNIDFKIVHTGFKLELFLWIFLVRVKMIFTLHNFYHKSKALFFLNYPQPAAYPIIDTSSVHYNIFSFVERCHKWFPFSEM